MTKEIYAVIWDFNGTLVDDLDLVVHSVNRQLAKRDLPSLTADRYRDVFTFPVQDYYRRIGVTFDNETMADLSADFFAEYAPALEGCPLHDGVTGALNQLKARGIRQFVLSAMEQGMLRAMIKHFAIAEFFEGVYGLAHQEGDSKVSRGRELLADFNIDPSAALMIGDTDHDAEVAHALHLTSALVSRGHQSGERLEAANHLVFSSVRELTKALFPEN